LDLEFGTWTNGLNSGTKNAYDSYFLAKPYLDKIKSGQVGTEELDAKVRRVLRLMFRTNMNRNRPLGKFTSPEHYAAARKIGAESIVLLKNDGNVLPIDPAKAGKILVVGENAIKMMTVGGGSSSLKVQHEISPLDGIRARFSGKSKVVFERGYVGDTGGSYNGVVSGQDLSDGRSPSRLISDAVSASKDADYVIFIGGLNKSDHQDSEGSDRLGLGLPYGQDALIEALAKANRNLIVVNISGNAISMPWVDEVPAIVQDWYLGSEAGNSLADVLSGDVDPSGKLPFTFPVSLGDGPIRTESQYPGIAGPNPDKEGTASKYKVIYDEKYSEGIFVGYRWYEKQGIRPLFPFGYGLSYTSFEIGNAKVSSKCLRGAGSISASAKPEKSKHVLKIIVPVRNVGKVAGAEVLQLYISDPECSVERPVKELKGFRKVFLSPGESTEAVFEIDPQDLAFFDEKQHAWVAEAGIFKAYVGTSSADMKTMVEFYLK
jgi:beta-glucosidase